MRKGNFYPKGVTRKESGTQFVFKVEKPLGDVRIGIFRGKKEVKQIPVGEEYRCGQLYCAIVEELPKRADGYCYYNGGERIRDAYARRVSGFGGYGKEKVDGIYRLPGEDYDWEEDRTLQHAYGTSIFYGIHVRGFTKHNNSGVEKKGTFAGVTEKTGYLKDLGITAVMLMPAYEFDELMVHHTPYVRKEKKKVNYWGFQNGYYYAPKSAYSYGEDPCREMKDMIKALHKADIEVIMRFYFPGQVKSGEIVDILHFWVQDYHIDGFHLMGEGLPMNLIATDPYLKSTKLIGYGFSCDDIYGEGQACPVKNLGVWRDSFVSEMRKFLKGDEDCINSFLWQLRDNANRQASIHAISDYNGFTLNDLVSYERKHNEENEEENRDGTDYNYSWNCGVEGKTRKKTILTLRQKQMRNALALVFLAQGTPYLQSGDEFGQTQGGNNNPYCQDNKTAWLNWKLEETNRGFLDYVKKLIAFRKSHKVFCQEDALQAMDYMGVGYPDISYHGEEAWKPVLENYCRHVGVMYYGKYTEDESLYIAYNMHWEPHVFALPKLPRGYNWRLCMDTEQPDSFAEGDVRKRQAENSTVTTPRSIRIYQAFKEEEEEHACLEAF